MNEAVAMVLFDKEVSALIRSGTLFCMHISQSRPKGAHTDSVRVQINGWHVPTE